MTDDTDSAAPPAVDFLAMPLGTEVFLVSDWRGTEDWAHVRVVTLDGRTRHRVPRVRVVSRGERLDGAFCADGSPAEYRQHARLYPLTPENKKRVREARVAACLRLAVSGVQWERLPPAQQEAALRAIGHRLDFLPTPAPAGWDDGTNVR